MKMCAIVCAGEPMFEVYDASDKWTASFAIESDALLFIATKAKGNL
jgi:hypothetical protein